jgi:hypothetical protein
MSSIAHNDFGHDVGGPPPISLARSSPNLGFGCRLILSLAAVPPGFMMPWDHCGDGSAMPSWPGGTFNL